MGVLLYKGITNVVKGAVRKVLENSLFEMVTAWFLNIAELRSSHFWNNRAAMLESKWLKHTQNF